MTHELKTWTEYFKDVKSGIKTFEVRKDDRDFQVGDFLLLKECDPQWGTYTGAYISTQVTYVLRGGPFVPDGICIMSIKIIP